MHHATRPAPASLSGARPPQRDLLPIPSTSTGPAPAPSSRRPSRTASAAIRLALRAASSGSWPMRQVRGERPRSGCSPNRARHRRGSARRGSRRAARRRRRGPSPRRGAPRSRPPPLARARGSRAQAPPTSASSPAAASTRASGRFGVTTRHARQQLGAQGVLGVLGEQPGAALGDHHGVEHHRRVAHELERPPHRRDRRGAAEHADLDRVDADVLRDRAHLLDDRLRRAPGRPR